MSTGQGTPRIAVVFPGNPRSPTTWSGTPSGVVRGLEEWGADVKAISAELPPRAEFIVRSLLAVPYFLRADGPSLRARFRLARAAARAGPLLNRLYGFTASSRLSNAEHVDGSIQVGTGYTIPPRSRYVTFEDLTVPQALDLRYPEFLALSARSRNKRRETQKRAYDGAVACCFTTHWAGDSAIAAYGIDPEKVHAVGVGLNHVVASSLSRDWRMPRFLFVGADWERKNGPAVLQAFATIRREYPGATLDVVGRHPPIEQDGVTGHGFRDLAVAAERAQAADLFSRATCFVMPSHYEPAGLVYVEAGAAGLPSIGTTVGGAAELIGDGGRVVDPSDGAQLCQAMRDLCDPATAAALGDAGRRRSELFTWRVVAERLVRALAPEGVAVDDLATFL